MDRQTRVFWYLAGCLLVTLNGCASWPTAVLSTSKTASSFESTLSLARLSERHGEPSTAERLYQAVLTKDPQNQVAHHRLAVLAIKEQQFDQAQHHFDQALTGKPDSELLSDWGYCLYLMDRLPEAEASLRQALQLDPGNIAAHNNLGLVLGTMDRMDESLAEFRYAGDEASARVNLAYVHSLNGEFEKSEAEYHHALELNSQLKPAAEALLALHARNDPNTASALAYTPTIRVQATDATQPFPGDRQPTTDSLSGQADRSSPQIMTVSYADQADGRELSSRATTAVEPTRPLMNLPADVNPAPIAASSTNQTQTNQEATQGFVAPASLQSLQSQPWQMPTWSAN